MYFWMYGGAVVPPLLWTIWTPNGPSRVTPTPTEYAWRQAVVVMRNCFNIYRNVIIKHFSINLFNAYSTKN